MEYQETLHGMGAAVQRGGSGLGRLLRRLLWLLWNLAVVLVSLPFAALALFALICIGTLTVLLLQGYPLVGVTLCCLGGLCCAAALFLLVVTLFHRRAGIASPAETILPVETELEVYDAQ